MLTTSNGRTGTKNLQETKNTQSRCSVRRFWWWKPKGMWVWRTTQPLWSRLKTMPSRSWTIFTLPSRIRQLNAKSLTLNLISRTERSPICSKRSVAWETLIERNSGDLRPPMPASRTLLTMKFQVWRKRLLNSRETSMSWRPSALMRKLPFNYSWSCSKLSCKPRRRPTKLWYLAIHSLENGVRSLIETWRLREWPTSTSFTTTISLIEKISRSGKRWEWSFRRGWPRKLNTSRVSLSCKRIDCRAS